MCVIQQTAADEPGARRMQIPSTLDGGKNYVRQKVELGKKEHGYVSHLSIPTLINVQQVNKYVPQRVNKYFPQRTNTHNQFRSSLIR